jgi:hypothetical protein
MEFLVEEHSEPSSKVPEAEVSDEEDDEELKSKDSSKKTHPSQEG